MRIGKLFLDNVNGGGYYLSIILNREGSMRKVFLTVFICFLLVLTACDGGMSNPGGTNPPAPETELGLPERIEAIIHPSMNDCDLIEDENVSKLESISRGTNIEVIDGASFLESYDKDGKLLMTVFREFKNGYFYRITYEMGDDLSSYTLSTVKEGSIVVENYILTSSSLRPQLTSLTIDGVEYEANSETDNSWLEELDYLKSEQSKSNMRSRRTCTFTIDDTQYSAIEDRYQIEDLTEVKIYSIAPSYHETSSFTFWFGNNNALNGIKYLRIDDGIYKGDYYTNI